MNYKNKKSAIFISSDLGYSVEPKFLYTVPETKIALVECTGFICASIKNETQVTSIFVNDTEVKTDDFTFDADVE